MTYPHELQQPGYYDPATQPPPVQPYGGYGYPTHQMQPGYAMMPIEHPQASTVQLLGIIGIFVGVLPFVAWYMGAEAKKEIQAGAPYPWDGKLKTGYMLGKIFSIVHIVLAGLVIAMYLGMFALMIGMINSVP